ncbi:hypothetical protein ABZ297_43335 [Nonomuraea sp. NPDC005983]
MTGLLRPRRCGFQAFAAAPDTRPTAGSWLDARLASLAATSGGW